MTEANARLMQKLRKLEADYAAQPSFEVARAMMDLRIQGGASGCKTAAPWIAGHDDRFAGVPSFPEIELEQLNAESLRAGILGRGAIIVRNLMDADGASRLREQISRALGSPARIRPGSTHEQGSDTWFHRSPLINGSAQGPASVASGDLSPTSGSVWSADAPVIAAELVAFYSRLGLREMLCSYFNEQARLSVRKWVLRCVPPKKGGNHGWHQDGRFMGSGIRSVNLWVAVSDCGPGTSAPGLELVADNRRIIHETGTQGAFFDWTVGHELVAELQQQHPVICPTFRAGDAIFFHHFCLHRTGEGPSDTLPRYAVESWFFAESTAPVKQQPLLF